MLSRELCENTLHDNQPTLTDCKGLVSSLVNAIILAVGTYYDVNETAFASISNGYVMIGLLSNRLFRTTLVKRTNGDNTTTYKYDSEVVCEKAPCAMNVIEL